MDRVVVTRRDGREQLVHLECLVSQRRRGDRGEPLLGLRSLHGDGSVIDLQTLAKLALHPDE
jgi:hypothetical protein